MVITIITLIITCSITWHVPTSLSLHILSIEVSTRVSSIIQNQTRAFTRPPRLLSLLLLRLVPPPHHSRHFLVLFPSGRAGVGGPWRPPSSWWVTWSRSWGHHDTATSTGCTLAILQQPMVRAHLHVAVPGFRWRASPAGDHAHGCSPRVPLSDPMGGPIPRVLVGSSTRSLAWVCRLGSGGLGALLQHHGPDTSSWAGVDRRLWGYLPHHS